MVSGCSRQDGAKGGTDWRLPSLVQGAQSSLVRASSHEFSIEAPGYLCASILLDRILRVNQTVALPKIHRLRQRKAFAAVYQSGLRRNSKHLTLRGLKTGAGGKSNRSSRELRTKHRIDSQSKQPHEQPNAPSPDPIPAATESFPTQFGISISQKVSKRAVIRNRIKRRIKAALRELLPCVLPGWHLVIVVRSNAVECDYKEFLQELKQLLIDAEVFDGHSGRCVL